MIVIVPRIWRAQLRFASLAAMLLLPGLYKPCEPKPNLNPGTIWKSTLELKHNWCERWTVNIFVCSNYTVIFLIFMKLIRHCTIGTNKTVWNYGEKFGTTSPRAGVGNDLNSNYGFCWGVSGWSWICIPEALLLTWINLIPAWISNYIHYKVWGHITYLSSNFGDG